jgi:ABC-type multidrug transport system fused ATPase/permease subunit
LARTRVEKNVMRFDRLVIEADENTFSLEFHPRLTVIGGVGRLEREGLITELVGSLSSSRAGVHAEIVADNGNRFAVFRPFGARARVIDVEAAADVSSRFADDDGNIDLLSVAGLDTRSAKRRLRLTSSDLTTSTHHDQIIRRLAAVEPHLLWRLAESVKTAQKALDEEADASGSAPEDAAVVTRIEERHARFEDAQSRAEKARKGSFFVGASAALLAVPSVVWVSQTLAMAFVILACMVTALSFVQNQRMDKAGKAEEQALAEAGAQSYLGFHLQRVNGLLDSQASRQRLIKAAADHEAAIKEWSDSAGDILVEWADEHRTEIDEATRRAAEVDAMASTPLPIDPENDEVAALASALVQRLENVRGIGPAGENLPLVLDDSLNGLAPELKAPLLEMLVRASEHQQIVFLTEDTDVTEWARVEAITGDLSILEPTAEETADIDVEAAETVQVA